MSKDWHQMNKKPKLKNRAEMTSTTIATLVSVARRQFGERGFASVVMDDLCAEADLTRGALHHHFGDKTGIFVAVVRAILAEVNGAMEDRFNQYQAPWDGYVEACMLYLDLMQDPALSRILLQDGPSVLGQRLRELEDATYIEPMVQGLNELQESGALHEFNALAMAHLISGAIGDSATWIRSQPTPEVAAAQAKVSLRLMLNGLKRSTVIDFAPTKS